MRDQQLRDVIRQERPIRPDLTATVCAIYGPRCDVRLVDRTRLCGFVLPAGAELGSQVRLRWHHRNLRPAIEPL